MKEKKTQEQLVDKIKILQNLIKKLKVSVSECKNEKKTILETKDKFQDFFDNAPVGYHSFRSDRIIYDINRAELDMIGFSRDEIVGKKTWADLILPEQKPIFERHWKRINETGAVRNIEYTLLHKNGRHIDVLLSATMMYNHEGRSVRTRGIVIDITNLKRTKKELENSELKLKKQKRALEEKTIALAQVISQIEIEKSKIKENIVTNIDELIMPNLQKLRMKSACKKYIDLLENNLKALVSPFGRKITDRSIKLTPREIEICNMIKNGLSSKEISTLLNLSLRTAERHRFNIRKKLEIGKKSLNLASFLQTQ